MRHYATELCNEKVVSDQRGGGVAELKIFEIAAHLALVQ
jgi:hypothetical protein